MQEDQGSSSDSPSFVPLPQLKLICCPSTQIHFGPIFAAAYFFNRAKILPFAIQSGRNKRGNMTPKAMAHLHGKCLMDLLTPREEVFIQFMVLLDIICYHSYSLVPFPEKYGILFSTQDTVAVLEFIETYT
jgi:hypothetical protein